MARKAAKQTKLNLMRLQRGMSREELAEKSKCSMRMVQLYEIGASKLEGAHFETVQKLAKALDCLCEDIVGDIDK